MAWQPIADGELADRARGAVDAIGAALTGATPGDAALFHAYAASVLGDDASAARLDHALEAFLARLERGFEAPYLAGGLASAGWIVAHISEDSDELAAVFDVPLGELVAAEVWTDSYDLLRGLVGYGVYFLERGEAGRAGVEHVVRHLAALAQHEAGGISWHTGPALLPVHQRADAPAGYDNCGVAHGIPGAIAFLARAAEAGHDRARELAVGAIAWLSARDLGPSPDGRFPAWIVGGTAPTRTRLAWCYGDLGIAVALWAAARRLGEPVERWHELAREAATRAVERTGVSNRGMCHGALGLAHLFNRCYQASGDLLLRAAARDWLSRGLAMSGDDGEDVIEGAAGAGLALLAALADEEPGWDRLFLCDLPPRQ
jgi:hypothetical protein